MSGDERRRIEAILTETASFYHRSLADEVTTYLIDERKFTQDIIERFQIGYANGGLRDHLVIGRHYPEDLCLTAGVLKKTESGEVRDYFFGRIIFPNLSRGNVIHLTGRRQDGQDPKYLHLPGELPGFYYEDFLDDKEVLIAEGVPDCLTAIQLGYSSVAVLGAGNFKPDYASKFSRCEKVFIAMDGDPAGEAAATRIGTLFPERARVVELPPGLDLNDFSKSHTPEEFHQLVRTAKRFPVYLLDRIPPNTEGLELADRISQLLKAVWRLNPAEIEHLLSEIRARFTLSGDEIRSYRRVIQQARRSGSVAIRINTNRRDESVKYMARFEGLVDLIEHEGRSAFWAKTSEGMLIKPHIDLNGIRYFPPTKGNIPWLLPKDNQVITEYQNCVDNPALFSQRLYDEIVNYIKCVSDLPNELFYDLLASWCFHTYLLEGVQYSPMICFFAIPERGKSRSGKALIYIAYRGIHVESLRDAYLIRMADYFGSSIFFDVKSMWKKALQNQSEDILLQRFERGAAVFRVLYPDRGPYKDMVRFSIFGPTLIATNEGIDKILETRALYVHMPEAYRNFENDVVPEAVLPIKEKLTAFRAWFLGQSLPDIRKPTSGRLGDILKPLLQVIRLVNPSREPAFISLVGELQRERLLDKSLSLDAEILEAVHGLLGRVERGLLRVQAITEQLNLNRAENFRLSNHSIGRRLTAMGFTRARAGDGAAAISYDNQQIIQMLIAYGLEEISETADSSEPQQPPPRES